MGQNNGETQAWFAPSFPEAPWASQALLAAALNVLSSRVFWAFLALMVPSKYRIHWLPALQKASIQIRILTQAFNNWRH